jgi:hypothetical protein
VKSPDNLVSAKEPKLTNLERKKEEASIGRHRMMALPNVLRDGSEQSGVGGAQPQPPFSNAQLNETATHREILNIYQHARPETRMFYDMGRDTDGLEEENWVIRWLLWHVFRYRDNRNKNRRHGSPSGARSPSSSEHSNSELQATLGVAGGGGHPHAMIPDVLHGPMGLAMDGSGGGGSAEVMPAVKVYYDPVRDT